MSTDHRLVAAGHEELGEVGMSEEREMEEVEEMEETPRSEVPPSFDIMTPGASEVAAARQRVLSTTSTPAPDADYFTPLALASEQQQSGAAMKTSAHDSSQAVTFAQHQPSDAASSLQLPARPTAQTQLSSLSIESSDSSVTVTPAPAISNTPRPPFPNQSYAALQDPFHTRGQPPPRRGGTNPHQIFTFSAAIAASLHSSGARTSHNSPAGTPGSAGLFNPAGQPHFHNLEPSESSGRYSSPFLHFTHQHVPKETHVADVEVDPISGRKLINHYEIIDELGRGTHGKVKLGRDLDTNNSYVAIKIVERFSKRRKLGRLGTTEDKVKKEVAILKKARHPNIVALLEVIDDPSRKKVYIVLEWVERGEIHWREKGPREIATIEARRYEREKSNLYTGYDQRTVNEDEAVLAEAQKRLHRQKRRVMKAFRQMKRETAAQPEVWSIELAGDVGSDDSGDDGQSYVSSATNESLSSRLFAEERRQSIRTSSPHPEDEALFVRSPMHRSITSEPEPISPLDLRRSSSSLVPVVSLGGLEGTMYGPYETASNQPSRVASLTHSSRSSHRGNQEGLTSIANEILDAQLDPELEYVPVMTMEQIRVALRDTVLGLQYLHYHGIVHRDIKPPNLLATYDNRVKISDFGVSHLGKPLEDGEAGEGVSEADARDLDDEAKELAKTVGTPAFYAPELCVTEHTDEPLPVTRAIDVWALGITLFCMLFARTPFVDNEFVVMRQIADEEIYIPRQRLQPVDSKSKSRASSHGRAFPPMSSGRRGELDLIYEEISDELYDLLKRLLIKNPRERITLEEVRRHPWVVEDIPNKLNWLDETDPFRQSEGKKIEVSNEDVKTAVVPLNIVERMRSGLKKVGERFGIGTKSSNNRLRAQSQAHKEGFQSPPSASSSSSTLSQEGRRNSLRGDESIFAALKASRESEHPLSKEVATTSGPDTHGDFFEEAPGYSIDNSHASVHTGSGPPRPSPPHRAVTVASTAGSMRTVRQSDYRPAGPESLPPSPGLPGPPLALMSPTGFHLGSGLGVAGRSIVQSGKGRGVNHDHDHLSALPEASSLEYLDAHAEASVAVSQTVAAGHVNPPEALKDVSPHTSSQGSSATSPEGLAHPQHNEPSGPSRSSSSSSITSSGRGRWHFPPHHRMVFDQRPQSRTAPESSPADWKRADDERIRKLIREGQEEAERTSRPASALSTSPPECPPSPDDATKGEDVKSRQLSLTESLLSDIPYEFSPVNSSTQMVSSSSDLASAVSASISNPSIPSAISEASSIDPNESYYPGEEDEKREASSDDTISRSSLKQKSRDQLDDGYTPDRENVLASDSDNDEDYVSSSDSDGGLQMTRRKSSAKQGGNTGSAPEHTKAGHRRNTGLSIRSRKSSRSGSNNTMRKIRTRDSIDERRRRSFETTEE